MNKTTFIILTLHCFSVYAEDFSWFNGKWISDWDATRAENTVIERMSEESIAKLKSLFRKTKWEVSDGFLTTIQEEIGADYQALYTINPSFTDGYDYEISLTDDDKNYTSFNIKRTKDGFCLHIASMMGADPNGGMYYTTWEGKEVDGIVECYKPFEA